MWGFSVPCGSERWELRLFGCVVLCLRCLAVVEAVRKGGVESAWARCVDAFSSPVFPREPLLHVNMFSDHAPTYGLPQCLLPRFEFPSTLGSLSVAVDQTIDRVMMSRAVEPMAAAATTLADHQQLVMCVSPLPLLCQLPCASCY